MSADTDALAAILAAHQLQHAFIGHGVAALASCSCGRTHENTLTASWPIQDSIHAAHLADVIAAHYAEREAQAWERGASFVASSPTGLDRKTWDNPYRQDQEADRG
jgi:hypothetical protein